MVRHEIRNGFILESIDLISQIPLTIFTNKGEVLYDSSNNEIIQAVQVSERWTEHLIDSAKNSILYEIDNNGLIYSCFSMPPDFQTFLLVGPASLQDIPFPKKFHFINEYFIFKKQELTRIIVGRISRIPLINFFSLLQVLHQLTKGKKIPLPVLLENSPGINLEIDESDKLLFVSRETGVYHHSYLRELQLNEIIRNGDLSRIDELYAYANIKNRVPGTISNDPLKNAKYLAIISITIIVRPAIQGGVSDEVAFSMSDAFMQEIDSCDNIGDVYDVVSKAIYELTYLVNQLNKGRHLSKPVKMCIDYIQKHLHDKITISKLADIIQISNRQLSLTFRKEMGQTINTFIHYERIKEAKSLLALSEMSLLDIYNSLGYASQSYFTKKFRELVGMTPAKYRQVNYQIPIVADIKTSDSDYLRLSKDRTSTYHLKPPAIVNRIESTEPIEMDM